MTSDRWQEIERLYHLARQQDPAKREAFLEKACEKDESLRREVGSLLASRSEAEDFIESPAMDVAARAIADDRVKQHSDLAGRTLLHYQIMKQVGSGGMGEVYQTKDLSLAALGSVIPEFARFGPNARFARSQTLASLNHPNIRPYMRGRTDGTQFRLSVEGETQGPDFARACGSAKTARHRGTDC
jgi:serine/threonine protein kinase